MRARRRHPTEVDSNDLRACRQPLRCEHLPEVAHDPSGPVEAVRRWRRVEDREERVLQEFIIGLLDPPVEPLHEPLAAVDRVDAAVGSHGLRGDVEEARDRPPRDAVLLGEDHHRLIPLLQPAVLDRIDQDIQVGGPLQPPPEIVDRVLTLEHAEHPVPVPLVTAPGPVFVPSQSIARGMIAVAGTAPGAIQSGGAKPSLE